MRKEYLEEIEKYRDEIKIIEYKIEKKKRKIKKLEKKLEVLYSKIGRVQEECDHTFPDGTSSIKDGFMYSTCVICGEDF